MSKQSESFVLSWAITNVHPLGVKSEGDLADAGVLAERCAREAAAQGITRDDLDAASNGNLVEHMRRALNIAQKAKQSN